MGASEGAGAVAAMSAGTGSVADGATAVTDRAGIFGAAVTVAIGAADETESGGKSAGAPTMATDEAGALGVAGVAGGPLEPWAAREPSPDERHQTSEAAPAATSKTKSPATPAHTPGRERRTGATATGGGDA